MIRVALFKDQICDAMVQLSNITREGKHRVLQASITEVTMTVKHTLECDIGIIPQFPTK